MSVESTSIDGVFVCRWPTFDDKRGFFRQTFQLPELRAAVGRDITFVQGNHSRSRPGTIRGFHAEPWDKLVYVARGTAMIALVDSRPDSTTFAVTATFHVGDAPGKRLCVFVPDGVAHAYATYGVSDVDCLYDVTELWRPTDKRAVAWNDPDLAIEWPVSDPVLSDEDRSNPNLRDRFPEHPRFADPAA